MKNKTNKVDYVKTLKKIDNPVYDFFKVKRRFLKKINEVIISDSDIDKIISSSVSVDAVIVLFETIIDNPDKFVINRPQFQKLCDIIINEGFIACKNEDFYYYKKFFETIDQKLSEEKTCLDYDEDGVDVVSSLDKLLNFVKEWSRRNDIPREVMEFINNIRLTQFKNMLNNLLKDDKEDNILLIKNTFGDVNTIDHDGNSLLMLCLKCELDDYELFQIISKLLEIGVNPNLRNYQKYISYDNWQNYNFLELIIKDNCLDEFGEIYIEEILKKSIECGYDINSKPSLIKFALTNRCKYSDKIYRGMCENEYNFLSNDCDKKTFSWGENVPNNEEIKKSIKYRTLIYKLGEKLEETSYKSDDNFLNSLTEIEKDICSYLESLIFFLDVSEETFSDLWREQIILNRVNNVNLLTGEIKAIEALNALKSMINNYINNFNETFDSCTTKINTYKNN